MSLRTRVLSVFPPPASVAMPSAGVDISGNSIKYVFLRGSPFGLEVQSFNETPLGQGIIVDGDIEKPREVVEVLRSYRLRHGIRHAVASIPERKAYLYQTLIPKAEADFRSAIESGLEAHVPLPPSETIFDFEPVRTVQAGTIVAVTAYAKRMVDAYAGVFSEAGIVLRSLEVESQALARAVLTEEDRKGVVMLVDLGRQATRIAIADNGAVSFTASVDMGGDALAGVIMKNFNISEAEAEKIKIEKGFLMNKENSDVVEALMITVSVMKDEIARHMNGWSAYSGNGLTRLPVEKVIVCGGNANLRGFPEYLETSLQVPVVVANVWANAFSLDTYVPPMNFQESLEYATAVGLAIRGSSTLRW